MTDNHCQRGLAPALNLDGILWRRVIDISDKGLAHIETGLDDVRQAPRRQTGFDLTAASEVMSILALATGLDLRERLGRIVVARSLNDEFVTAEQIGAAGAMTALLRNALRPNLVQTGEAMETCRCASQRPSIRCLMIQRNSNDQQDSDCRSASACRNGQRASRGIRAGRCQRRSLSRWPPANWLWADDFTAVYSRDDV